MPPSEWVEIVTVNRVPGDLQVRVMAHRLRRGDQGIDEFHRADEVVPLEGFDDRLAGALPALEVRQSFVSISSSPSKAIPGQIRPRGATAVRMIFNASRRS